MYTVYISNVKYLISGRIPVLARRRGHALHAVLVLAVAPLRRWRPGLAVRRERELFLVDCGEGTQRQMIRYATGFDVAAIFFTHFHADHYLGAIGFLRTLSMQGRTEPMDLYGPKPARRLLDVMLFTGTEKLAFPVRIHEIAPGFEVERDGCRMVAWRGLHLLNGAAPGRRRPARARARPKAIRPCQRQSTSDKSP